MGSLTFPMQVRQNDRPEGAGPVRVSASAASLPNMRFVITVMDPNRGCNQNVVSAPLLRMFPCPSSCHYLCSCNLCESAETNLFWKGWFSARGAHCSPVAQSADPVRLWRAECEHQPWLGWADAENHRHVFTPLPASWEPPGSETGTQPLPWMLWRWFRAVLRYQLLLAITAAAAALH